MSPETLFSVVGKLAIVGWALLIFLPRWRWTQRIAAVIVPVTLSAMYLALLLLHIRGSAGGFGSLAQVEQLFQNPWLLLAGWVHYLAFDLFLGAWQVREAQRLGISHLFLLLLTLPLTFLFGPVGFLAFWTIRSLTRRNPFLDSAGESNPAV